jgi:hypothetical protein
MRDARRHGCNRRGGTPAPWREYAAVAWNARSRARERVRAVASARHAAAESSARVIQVRPRIAASPYAPTAHFVARTEPFTIGQKYPAAEHGTGAEAPPAHVAPLGQGTPTIPPPKRRGQKKPAAQAQAS